MMKSSKLLLAASALALTATAALAQPNNPPPNLPQPGAAAGPQTPPAGNPGADTPPALPGQAAPGGPAAAPGKGQAPAPGGNYTPTFGATDIMNGFPEDPITFDIVAGGQVEAATRSTGDTYCPGYIAEQPDYQINYTAGSWPLYIYAQSDVDTTLVIEAPDGSIHCDDDSAGNLDPLVSFDTPLSGAYYIWVGTYSPGQNPEATLGVSELGGPQDNGSQTAGSTDLDPFGTPTYGEQNITNGFTPDPFTIQIQSGGAVDASTLDPACRGYIYGVPDLRLNYMAGSWPLYISAMSEGDTTIVVLDPNGNWVCDDDAAGNLNPVVAFPMPTSGAYQIWVGTYGSNTLLDATLSISELGPQPYGGAQG